VLLKKKTKVIDNNLDPLCNGDGRCHKDRDEVFLIGHGGNLNTNSGIASL